MSTGIPGGGGRACEHLYEALDACKAADDLAKDGEPGQALMRILAPRRSSSPMHPFMNDADLVSVCDVQNEVTAASLARDLIQQS